MPADPQLAELARRVGEFHITDRAMSEAQRGISAAIASGETSPRETRRYLEAVRRYFSGFENEARAHLRDLDRRLEQLHQVQFNLTAERGVAAKRIEVTHGVLADADALERSIA